MRKLFSKWWIYGTRPWSISFQLLLIVNSVLGIAIIALLIFRYSSEMENEVHKKYLSLNDEAIAIHGAASHLQNDHHTADIQSYIDTVCVQMEKATLQCHNIAVEINGNLIQAQTHLHEHPELFSTIAKAAASKNHRGQAEDHMLVAASYAGDGITVYVSENLNAVHKTIRQDLQLQLFVLGSLGLIAAGIVNVVLVQVVGKPLNLLLETVDEIAAGNFGVESPLFKCDEMLRLSQAINLMSQTLQNNDRDRQLQMAKAQQIQQYLLPSEVRLPGLQAAHLFQPADLVAGDYYDFVPLSDGTWLICLADVTGHGIPAAMGATMLKSLLLSAAEQPPFDTVSIISEINRRFVRTVLPGNFASMFLGRWKPQTHEFCWTSAGHDPGYLLNNSNEITLLNSTGMLLGIDEDAHWHEKHLFLKPHDQVLLYSDGAPETHCPEGELFGRERLLESFRSASQLPIQHGLEKLENDLSDFRANSPRKDDLTLVLIKAD